MEYLDDCSTTIKRVARKVAAIEGGLVCLEVISPQGYSFWMGGLAYGNTLVLSNTRKLDKVFNIS